MIDVPQVFLPFRNRTKDLFERRYELLQQLGRGGQGTVWKAIDHEKKRPVAIKILNDASDSALRARFEQEIRTLAAMEFPSIVPIYNEGKTRWHGGLVYYFVMRFEEGQTLQDRLARAVDPLHPSECVRIASDVLRALMYAHERRIVHRDLKPSNIIQRSEGAIVLVDFGIATAPDSQSKSTHIFATPQYAAPERFDHDLVLNRDLNTVGKLDVYSLGMIMYEMLTLRPPSLIRHHPPALCHANRLVSPLLSEVVHKALARKPEHRLSLREFASALEDVNRQLDRTASIDTSVAMCHIQQINDWLRTGDSADLNNAVGKLRELEDEGWSFAELLNAKRNIAELWLNEVRRLRKDDEQLILRKLEGVLRFSYQHPEALRIARDILTPKIEAFVGRGHYTEAVTALRHLVRLDWEEANCSEIAHLLDLELAAKDREFQQVEESLNNVQAYRDRHDLFRAAAELQAISDFLEYTPEAPDRFRESVKHLQTEIDNLKEQVAHASAQAVSELRKGEYVQAVKKCEDALQKCPAHPELLATLVQAKELHRRQLFVRFIELEQQIGKESEISERLRTLQGHSAQHGSWSPYAALLDFETTRHDALISLKDLLGFSIEAGDLDLAGRCSSSIAALQGEADTPALNLTFDRERIVTNVRNKAQWQKRIEHLIKAGRMQVARLAVQEARANGGMTASDLEWEASIQSQIAARLVRARGETDSADRAIVRALQLLDTSIPDATGWVEEALQFRSDHALAGFLLDKIKQGQTPEIPPPATPVSRTRELINKLVKLKDMVRERRPSSRVSQPVPVIPSAVDGPDPAPAMDAPLTPVAQPASVPSHPSVWQQWRGRLREILSLRARIRRRHAVATVLACLSILAIIGSVAIIMRLTSARAHSPTNPSNPPVANAPSPAEPVEAEPPKPPPPTPSIRVFSDFNSGSVRLDDINLGRPGVELTGALQAGAHQLLVETNAIGKASLAFSVSQDNIPVLAGQPTATGLKLMFLFTSPSKASICTNLAGAGLQLDNTPIVPIEKTPKDIPAIPAGKHRVAFVDGDQVFERSIEFGDAPSLLVLATYDYGSVEVLGNVEGLKITLDGKVERTIENGKTFFNRLRPGEHSLTVTPGDDYLPVDASTVTVLKGKKLTQTIQLTPKPKFAALRIQNGLSDAQVSIAGKVVGSIHSDGSLSIDGIAPGEQAIELTKPGYRKISVLRRFQAGEAVTLSDKDIRLERLPGKLDVHVTPADAKVAIRRLPDGPVQTFQPGRPRELSEGKYLVSAELDGYEPKSKEVAITADQLSTPELILPAKAPKIEMADWDKPQDWTKAGNIFTNPHTGYAVYKRRLEPGSFSFQAFVKDRRAIWLIGYNTEGRNYLLFQLDHKNFTQTLVSGREPPRTVKREHKLKNLDKALEWVEISVTLNSNGTVHHKIGVIEFNEPASFVTATPDLISGKFGFRIPEGEPLAISGFRFEPATTGGR